MAKTGFSPTWRILALIATGLTLVVVILGAFTRLTDAGLGCPDWPGCYGQLIVPSSAQAAQVYPHFPLETHKALNEMVHRYAATTLGLIIISLCLMAWWQRQRLPKRAWILPGVLLLLVIFQGLLGMWTVTLRLHPTVVMAHLLGGFTLLSLLSWLSFKTFWQPTPLNANTQSLKRWAKWGLVIVVMQIALGGWTSANYAALSCPDFPMCQGQWIPPIDIPQAFTLWHPVGPNFEGGILDNTPRVTIHLAHRLGAFITLLVIGVLSITLLRNLHTRLLGSLLGGLLLLQITLGILNVVKLLPLPIAVAHNGVAALLLVTLLAINYRLHRAAPLSARE